MWGRKKVKWRHLVAGYTDGRLYNRCNVTIFRVRHSCRQTRTWGRIQYVFPSSNSFLSMPIRITEFFVFFYCWLSSCVCLLNCVYCVLLSFLIIWWIPLLFNMLKANNNNKQFTWPKLYEIFSKYFELNN